MFEQFPKERPPLPQAYQEIYEQHYSENREGRSTASSMATKLERWMHRQVAKDVRNGQSVSTLEVGAGTLNHPVYEPEVRPYDVVEPWDYLLQRSNDLDRVRTVYKDICEIPEGTKYDRIISIATLEHILNLPEAVARIGLLLNDGATFRAAIPGEGTVLWKLGQMVSTGLEFRLKYGLDYFVLIRHEHVNSAKEIEQVLHYFFADVKCRVFGICRCLSLYQFYACSQVHTDRCRQYLENLKNAGGQTQ